MLKTLMMTTALTGLLIGGAAAQTTPSTTTPTPPAATAPAPGASSSAQTVNIQKPDQWLASKFRGMDVVGADNVKIGDVSDILFDRTGKIEAYVVSVGGFLGMGAKDVAMAPNAFTVVAGDKAKNEDDKLQVSMSKDQLTQAASFEAYNPTRTTTGAGGTAGTRPATSGGMSRP